MMLLMSALMGLVFLSNASGHDDMEQTPKDDDQALEQAGDQDG